MLSSLFDWGDDMVRWLLYLPFSLLASVLCYITNPLVLLFCDKDGELPGVFHLWQTWDNSCNPSDIKSIAPGWLLYDWDAHYKEYQDTTQYLRSVNRSRWYTACVNDEWTLWERVKRYLCRCIWLTRNNAYGFGFYLLGHTATPYMTVMASENTKTVRELDGDGWMYKNTAKIFSAFGWEMHWNNLLGWKLDESAKLDTRSMIANRVAFFFRREAE